MASPPRVPEVARPSQMARAHLRAMADTCLYNRRHFNCETQAKHTVPQVACIRGTTGALLCEGRRMPVQKRQLQQSKSTKKRRARRLPGTRPGSNPPTSDAGAASRDLKGGVYGCSR